MQERKRGVRETLERGDAAVLSAKATKTHAPTACGVNASPTAPPHGTSSWQEGELVSRRIVNLVFQQVHQSST